MHILKILILSIVIGLLGYEASKLLVEGSLAIPAGQSEVILLVIFIATSLLTTLASNFNLPLAADDSEREDGTVKWFNVRKGYGFITRDQGDDVFVHFRNIEGKDRQAIDEGQRVSFVVIMGDKGLQADKVVPA